ncbi:response regulator, partial [bacterium]
MKRENREFDILVIEDNPGDFVLVEDLLYDCINTPHVYSATTFESASVLIRGRSKPFDIVLLDLTLPDHQGEDLINDVVNVCDQVPVIVLTGYTDFDFGVRSLS